MRLKSHCVYSPKIIQTSWLGRLQKKSLEQIDSFYAASVSEQYQEIVSALEQHQRNLFERNFADLRYVFVYFLHNLKRDTFSSTVFLISMLVFFLIRKKSSEGVLEGAIFGEPSKNISERVHFDYSYKLPTKLKRYYRYFFGNLVKIYRTAILTNFFRCMQNKSQ